MRKETTKEKSEKNALSRETLNWKRISENNRREWRRRVVNAWRN